MKITLLLIFINVLVFLNTIATVPETATDQSTGKNVTVNVTEIRKDIADNYGFSINNFESGKYYVAVTAMFLHANILHILSNMIALFFLGYAVEQKAKGLMFFSAYMITGIIGNLVTFFPIFGYDPNVILIGASGAIFGIIGFGTFLIPTKWVIYAFPIPLPFILAGVLYFFVTYSNLFIPSETAYAAHLGGFMAGAVFGLTLGEERVKSLTLFILLLLLMITVPIIVRTL